MCEFLRKLNMLNEIIDLVEHSKSAELVMNLNFNFICSTCE